jgi:hypothetical protein
MGASTSFGFYWSRSKYTVLSTIIIAVACTLWSCYIKNSLPAALAGALLTLVGVPLTFSRLIRRGPAGSNDPDPPLSHPQKPGEIGVQLNTDAMWAGVQRILENFHVINGIIMLEVGTLLWGVVAPIVSAAWPQQ